MFCVIIDVIGISSTKPRKVVVNVFLVSNRSCRSGILVVVTMPLHLFVLEALASMGYTRSEIEDSLGQAKYDDVFATYLLLGRKTTDVSRRRIDLETCRINVCEVKPLRTNVTFAIIVKFYSIFNIDIAKRNFENF